MSFKEFQTISEGEIFRVVTTKYHTVERIEGKFPALTFVCKKGVGNDDWAIYCHYPDMGVAWIAQNGDKVKSNVNILSIFPCDPETMDHYRM